MNTFGILFFIILIAAIIITGEIIIGIAWRRKRKKKRALKKRVEELEINGEKTVSVEEKKVALESPPPSETPIYKSKAVEVVAVVYDKDRHAEIKVGTPDKLEPEFKNRFKEEKEDKKFKTDVKRIFTQWRWFFGWKIKNLFLFYNLTKDNIVEGYYLPDGIDKFDETETISTEEADLMIHEDITYDAAGNIVPKISIGGGSRLWIFVVIAIVIIAVVVAFWKLRGG